MHDAFVFPRCEVNLRWTDMQPGQFCLWKLIFAVHIKIQCRMQFLPFNKNKREKKTHEGKKETTKRQVHGIACPIDRGTIVSRMVWYAVCALFSSPSLSLVLPLFASLSRSHRLAWPLSCLLHAWYPFIVFFDCSAVTHICVRKLRAGRHRLSHCITVFIHIFFKGDERLAAAAKHFIFFGKNVNGVCVWHFLFGQQFLCVFFCFGVRSFCLFFRLFSKYLIVKSTFVVFFLYQILCVWCCGRRYAIVYLEIKLFFSQMIS